MSAIGSISGSGSDRNDRAVVLAATRSQSGVVAALLGLAAVAWWSTVERMAGMDAGPGTTLGALGWFTGVWVVMMAAMMLPSLAPTAAVYAALTRRRTPTRPLLVAAGYLLVWSAAGIAAYAVFALGKGSFASELAWQRGGRWLAVGVLVVAGLYQLTPAKLACLRVCRSPARFVRGSRREGGAGALAVGLRAGGWCLGCSWALMAALFALGVMSVTWMALVAALVALEKIGPSRRAATMVTAAVLLALAVVLFAAPHSVPGLVVPGGSPGAMHAMKAMG